MSMIDEAQPAAEQRWVGFDFAAAFGSPVKVINDAAMQAPGSCNGGTKLFLGLGTGLGSNLILRGRIVPMGLGTLAYGKGAMEDILIGGGNAKKLPPGCRSGDNACAFEGRRHDATTKNGARK